MKKYLITGGAGFIGSALARRLARLGNFVRVLDNESRGRASRLKDVIGSIEFIHGDVRDSELVLEACRGVDAVCHLASVNGTESFYTKPDYVLDVAVRGMVNVMEGCMKAGVKEFWLASSSEVYQTAPEIPTDEKVPLSIPDVSNPRYSYGGGKIISELIAIHYGRKHFKRVLIFRPHNVYGPDMGYEHVIPQFVIRMKLLSEEKKGLIDFPIQGTGKETRAFVFIEDFLHGLELAISKGEEFGTYHIGTEEEITIAQVAREVARFFNRTIRIVPGNRLEGSTVRRCPDITKLKRLGYQPKVCFREGLQRTAQWYVTQTRKEEAVLKGA